jgi:transcription elongation factor Elf1
MISPCPKCGATKTDPVPHAFKYNLARALGYRLQKCSRCRAARYLPRHTRRPDGSSQAGKQPTSAARFGEEPKGLVRPEASAGLEGRREAAADFPSSDVFHCPACGSKGYHRTERTTRERILHHPPMARCEICGLRFPHPGHPSSTMLAEAPATGSETAEEEQVPTMTKENAQAKASEDAARAKSLNDDVPKCPSCGSSKYHRTERTALEKALKRPPMARCERCGKRFPYATHPDEPKASRPAGKKTHTNAGEEAAAAGSSNQESGRCPFCGSSNFRRSRRTAAERLLFRPKMARCSHCRKRFPLPES